MKIIIIFVLASALLLHSPTQAQIDLGCIGDRDYRMLDNGDTVYAPILCKFGEPNDAYVSTLEETKRLYIERLPADLRREALERERQKKGEPAENWQKFLDQTGRSFD